MVLSLWQIIEFFLFNIDICLALMNIEHPYGKFSKCLKDPGLHDHVLYFLIIFYINEIIKMSVKIKVISRNPDDYLRATKRDIHKRMFHIKIVIKLVLVNFYLHK